MSKKLMCFIAFVLVLGMASTGSAQLEGYWPLDGDLLDASGNGRHGTWRGDPNAVLDPNSFEPGAIGLGLAFDGAADYISIDGYKGILGPNSFSITAWINTSAPSGDIMAWGSTAGGVTRFEFRTDADELRAESSGNVQGLTKLPDNEWIHVAVTVKDAATINEPDVTLYLNGQVDSDAATGGSNPLNMAAGYDLTIGRRHTAAQRQFDGLIDDVQLYSRELTAEQVQEVMNGGFPQWPKADKPDPADGTMIEDTVVFLGWRAGQGAASHNVYFGTTTELGPDQLASQQTDNQYVATDLVPNQTYYWRVDEVAADGTVTPGDLWSLWTPPRSAYDPQPDDGVRLLDTTATLSWTGGWSPIMHQTYFGTDANTVANATGAPLSMDATFDPGPLEWGTTYYWRVDEFYGTDTVAGPVWSFSTVPIIPLTADPNLVAHWTMDDATGGVVLDMSGNANHGIVKGDPQIVEGLVAGAMEFDGIDDYLDMGDNSINGVFDFNSVTLTIVGWVKPSRLLPAVTNHNISNVLLSRGSDPENDNFEFGFSEDGNAMVYTDTKGLDGSNHDTTRIVGGGEITVGEWHQFVLVYDANAVDVYLDGTRYSTSVDGVSFDEADGSPFTIGDTLHIETPYGGSVDDVRIYNRAMTLDEVRQNFGDVTTAYSPDPAPASVGDIWTMSVLSWLAGEGAVEHDVYLGVNKAAVKVADASDATGIYRGRQAETSYVSTVKLDFDQKYYWRIDEVAADGTISTGNVWSFTTTSEIVLSDEDIPFPYDNSVDPFVSEFLMDLVPALDMSAPVARLAISYTGQAAPGSVTVDEVNGTITVVGRGADIAGTADEFQFAHTMLTMNGSMTVKVDSFAHTHNWSKAGIMIRETLDPSSAFAAVYATGANGVRFEARAMAGTDQTNDTAVATAEAMALTAPVWLKIERMFPFVNAYYSTDGVTWVPMAWNPQVVPMSPAPIYIGLAVTSHSGDSTYAEAVFSNLTSDGGVVAGPLASTEIGGMASNSAEPMYLVLTDASGASAAVLNPDPAATQKTAATDWIVDLDQFAIDRTAIAKAGMVLGNLDTPTPGGTGMLTIHNVKLLGPKGPVGYWAFNETSGTTASDGSGNGNDGTLVGGPAFVQGMAGYGMALDFDGVDDVVELGKFDVVGSGITLAAWIRPDSFTINDGRIISKANEWGSNDHWWMLSTVASGGNFVPRFRLKTDESNTVPTLIGTSGVLTAGQWSHVTATWDGASMIVYVDGVEAGLVAKGGSAVAVDPTVSVAIGSQPADAFATDLSHVAKFFDGLIDEVRIYDRALPAAEILKLAGN